jgi:hypothetical protein
MKWFVERQRCARRARLCQSSSLDGTSVLMSKRPAMRNQPALATCCVPRVSLRLAAQERATAVASTTQRAARRRWAPSRSKTTAVARAAAAQLDRVHPRALDELDPVLRDDHGAQVVLEAAAVELPAPHDGLGARADLGAVLQRQLAPAGEEAQAQLGDLPRVEVVRQPEAREVLRGDLDRRLADLVAAVGERPRLALDDRDRGAGQLAADLAREEQDRPVRPRR